MWSCAIDLNFDKSASEFISFGPTTTPRESVCIEGDFLCYIKSFTAVPPSALFWGEDMSEANYTFSITFHH
jgi:hypothetical protein